MKEIIERNVALILTLSIFVVMFMSSCGSTKPHHACGITELNKQYKIKCKSRR